MTVNDCELQAVAADCQFPAAQLKPQRAPSQVAVPGPVAGAGQGEQLVPQLAVEVLLRQALPQAWKPPMQMKLQVPPPEQTGVEFGGFDSVQSSHEAPHDRTPGAWQVASGQRRVPGEQGPPPETTLGTGAAATVRGRAGRRAASQPTKARASGRPRSSRRDGDVAGRMPGIA
ncbi:MAG: hypothetical protein NVSMB23_30800 [Myxococcales bacterium]